QCGGRDEKGGPFEEVEFPKTSTEQSATSVPHPPAAKFVVSAWFDVLLLLLLLVDQGSAERDAKETHKNIKDASGEIKKTAENVREKISAAADQVVDKTIEAAGNVIDSAQGGRAKEGSQSAWGSAKETMQKIKDTVVGKAEESQQSIKDGRENTKRAMDAKN
ncbi:hypothetical protein BHM03_00001388, partial [Ensete ventricosum]